MSVALLFGTAVWLGWLLLFLRVPGASLFHPALYYLFFHGLVFVLRPWLNWWYDYRFIYQGFGFSPTPAERVTALLVASLGLSAFMCMALLVGRDPLRPRATAARAAAHRRYPGSLGLAALLCAPVALWSLVRLVRASFVPTTMAMDPATGILVNTDGNGYLFEANAMLIPLVVLCAWFGRFRLGALLPFLAYVAARLIHGGGRWAFMMAAASLALFFVYDRGARWFRWPAVLVAVLAIIPFTLLGHDRALFQAAVRPDAAVHAAPPVLAPLEDENYANQEFLEYLVRVVPARSGGYGWFLDNLQLFTEPVPRVLWPNKPIGAPLGQPDLFRWGRPVGMTLSVPGEGWVQAGWAGVAIWSALYGLVAGLTFRWFARCRQTEFQVAAYLLLLPLSVQLFRDGTLVTAVRFPSFYLPPLGLWWLLARLNGRRIVPARQWRPA